MQSLKVLFLHGSQGGPTDSTARYLNAHFDAVTPSLPTFDYVSSFILASKVVESFRPDVIVAESFGAAIAYDLVARSNIRLPMVLMCPAISKVRKQLDMDTDLHFPRGLSLIVVHGTKDDIISYRDIEDIMNAGDPGTTKLVLVDDDHNMRKIVNGIDIPQLKDLVEKVYWKAKK